MKQPKIAIVHDWLYGGGAEKVVLELHKIYPEAPIYTSYCSKAWREKLNHRVVTGYLQFWPFAKLRKFLPLLRQWWFASLKLDEFDIIISSSGNGEAKFVKKTRPGQIHICYCHTPTHFYWRHYDSYIKQPSFRPKWLARFGLKLLVKPLSRRDFAAAQKVDYFLANSTNIQSDIKKFYQKDSTLIFPPVDTSYFKKLALKKPSQQLVPQKPHCVSWGRVVPMKRLDIAISACEKLGFKLSIMGDGPDINRLQKLAGKNTEFLGFVSDKQREKIIAEADLFLFCSFEDFGIAPVEALAAGLPVIAYRAGGAIDYIDHQKNGWFFDEQDPKSLEKQLKLTVGEKLTTAKISNSADKFSGDKFQKRIKEVVMKIWKDSL